MACMADMKNWLLVVAPVACAPFGRRLIGWMWLVEQYVSVWWCGFASVAVFLLLLFDIICCKWLSRQQIKIPITFASLFVLTSLFFQILSGVSYWATFISGVYVLTAVITNQHVKFSSNIAHLSTTSPPPIVIFWFFVQIFSIGDRFYCCISQSLFVYNILPLVLLENLHLFMFFFFVLTWIVFIIYELRGKRYITSILTLLWLSYGLLLQHNLNRIIDISTKTICWQ